MLCKECKIHIIELFGRLTSRGEQLVSEVFHCDHKEQEREIIACKLTNPTNQCIDYDLKIERGWCKDCLNHIIIINGMKLDE